MANETCIALLPGRAVLRAGGRLVEQTAGEGWDGALQALSGLLKDARPRGKVAVVLSHFYARAQFMEPPPLRLTPAEMEGWIAGRLVESYGSEAASWRAVWQDVPPGRVLPVALMEGLRYDTLVRHLREAGLDVNRAEPWFSVAWNRHRRSIRGDGWLALLEPGRLALARVQGGRPVSLRFAQTGAAPMEVLGALMARESLNLGVATPGTLWLAAVGVAVPEQAELGGCAMRSLLPAGVDGSGLLP